MDDLRIMADGNPLEVFNKTIQRLLSGELDKHLKDMDDELRQKREGNRHEG